MVSMARTRPIPIRLDAETIARADRLAATMSRRAQGAQVTRAAALRRAIEIGLAQLERKVK